MGCNIHGWIEVKQYNYWTAQTREPMDDRNYSLFAYLANVRNYTGIEPLSQPRGYPPNVAELTKKEIEEWSNDGHSHSWVSAEEIMSMPMLLHFNDTWMDWLKIFKTYVRTYGGENVRFVFWFDN